MIELRKDSLVFSFPDVHPDAVLQIDFQRTLRIPDDGRDYPLPPGLGLFPLRHVDDFAGRLPVAWVKRGGVMFPMYQSEALWLNFRGVDAPFGGGRYPFAVKVATGKINAVTGGPWNDGLHRDPQDYLAIPAQPWLDGYCVEEGIVRQFVAMPLGEGYTAEEQVTGEAEFGGLQIVAYPLKREAWERHLAVSREWEEEVECCLLVSRASRSMGLAPGGRMRQVIYDDPHAFTDWDTRQASRCFVHLTNSLTWRGLTGEAPPAQPPTSAQCTKAGLPWFEYYAEDSKAVQGSPVLKGLKSVQELGKEKRSSPLPENESVEPGVVVALRRGLRPGQVRAGEF